MFNQCVDVTAGWRGSYFTIKGMYQCPPDGSHVADGFEGPVAWLTDLSQGQYALAYFWHTVKWEVIFPALRKAQRITSPFCFTQRRRVKS
jgi:hypothetical protein